MKNYTDDNALGTTSRIWRWNILCTIKLKDIHDFFKQIPLVKGASLRFTLNYNSARIVVNATTSGTTLTQATYTQLSGKSNPIMMASAAASNPSAAVAALATDPVLTIECNVAKTSNPVVAGSGTLASCRLYVPSYTMNPVSMKELIGLKENHSFEYEEIYNYNFINVAAGGSFNQILTNGIVNPKALVIIPMVNSADNASIIPYQSIFDSAPGTTCPLAAVTNFNVALAGKNIFMQNVDYDFDMFINEVAPANALNGGYTVGLTSGLLSKKDWDNSYRYLVADLSRGSIAVEGVPQSVQVSGVNSTAVAMDYFCFVVYSRKAKLNVVTSELLSLV
jgi:hypothetical protein